MKNHLLKTTCLLMLYFLGGIGQSFSQNQTVTFTMQDRERLIRMEEQMKSLKEEMKSNKEEMNNRFNTQKEEFNSRFNSLKEELNVRFQTLYTLIYFILGGVFGLIGLIFWDRRSYIKPVKEELKHLQAVLREFSKKQPELAELMRAQGLL